MPLYEYTCQKCNQKFEILRSFSQSADNSPACEHCGSSDTERCLSTVIAMIGSGEQRKVIAGGSSCGSCTSSGSTTCGTCSGGR